MTLSGPVVEGKSLIILTLKVGRSSQTLTRVLNGNKVIIFRERPTAMRPHRRVTVD